MGAPVPASMVLTERVADLREVMKKGRPYHAEHHA